jgi:hypothetical protein
MTRATAINVNTGRTEVPPLLTIRVLRPVFDSRVLEVSWRGAEARQAFNLPEAWFGRLIDDAHVNGYSAREEGKNRPAGIVQVDRPTLERELREFLATGDAGWESLAFTAGIRDLTQLDEAMIGLRDEIADTEEAGA